MRLSLIICLVLFIMGCGYVPDRGGAGNITTTTNEIVHPDGSSEKSVITETSIEQPDNPQNGAGVEYSADAEGNVKIRSNTSGSFNTTKDKEEIRGKYLLLGKVIFAGLLFVIAGAAAFIIRKKWQDLAILGGIGVFLIILGIVLASYAWVFAVIIGLSVLGLLGYGAYILINLKKNEQSVPELVDTVQGLKSKYMTEEERLAEFRGKGGIVDLTQSPTTKKLVNKIKANQKKKEVV